MNKKKMSWNEQDKQKGKELRNPALPENQAVSININPLNSE